VLNDQELLRYSRQILLQHVDIDGQLRLKASRVLIVGLGGLGSPVALYLAAAGVGELHLADFDSVDLTNLQRQIIHDTDSVGVSKVDSAIRRLSAINPEIQLIAHRTALDEDSLAAAVAAVDLVLDCSDNFSTREAVNAACVRAGKPLVSGVRSTTPGKPLLPLFIRTRQRSRADLQRSRRHRSPGRFGRQPPGPRSAETSGRFWRAAGRSIVVD